MLVNFAQKVRVQKEYNARDVTKGMWTFLDRGGTLIHTDAHDTERQMFKLPQTNQPFSEWPRNSTAVCRHTHRDGAPPRFKLRWASIYIQTNKPITRDYNCKRHSHTQSKKHTDTHWVCCTTQLGPAVWRQVDSQTFMIVLLHGQIHMEQIIKIHCGPTFSD